jgi:ribosome-associated heat shock protein Hsp15
MAEPHDTETLRIDKWLWHARFCKTRSIAQERASKGRIRLNGHRVEKPGVRVKPGDVMTLVAGGEVLVVRIRGLGVRRGPANEARLLYEIIEDA